ncbi:hypothetical protein, partial [Roseibacillus ishigakijimensis]|uniref:hypothetical protein n=1 Tax=Roseibacillus ishigakijimensis TaxID=454146 RepID=UPI001F47A7F0
MNTFRFLNGYSRIRATSALRSIKNTRIHQPAKHRQITRGHGGDDTFFHERTAADFPSLVFGIVGIFHGKIFLKRNHVDMGG